MFILVMLLGLFGLIMILAIRKLGRSEKDINFIEEDWLNEGDYF